MIAVPRRPERYRTSIVPHIHINGASEGIEFYKKAFGAIELFRVAHPDGKILHAEISIGGSVVMIGDRDDRLYAEPSALGRCTTSLHIFLDDNAAFLRCAVQAGAEEISVLTEMFYGANSASVRDPYGHVWVAASDKTGSKSGSSLSHSRCVRESNSLRGGLALASGEHP